MNTPVLTSPPTTSATWVDWAGSTETTSNRWLRNWARNPAAAARPPGVTSSPASTRAATRPAATPRALVPSRATRPRRGNGTGSGTAAGAVATGAGVAAATRARRCSNRVRAAWTAAGDGGASGAVRAIAGAASSALRWSSARVSAQEAQACTWSCSGGGVPAASSSSDARRAPRSGQGIVGSRVEVVTVEVGLAEGPLAAGQQDPDRADGEVEGRGDLRV